MSLTEPFDRRQRATVQFLQKNSTPDPKHRAAHEGSLRISRQVVLPQQVVDHLVVGGDVAVLGAPQHQKGGRGQQGELLIGDEALLDPAHIAAVAQQALEQDPLPAGLIGAALVALGAAAAMISNGAQQARLTSGNVSVTTLANMRARSLAKSATASAGMRLRMVAQSSTSWSRSSSAVSSNGDTPMRALTAGITSFASDTTSCARWVERGRVRASARRAMPRAAALGC